MAENGHTWYPQDDPLAGDPNSKDAFEILRSLHTESGSLADKYLSADDRKALRKNGE